MKQESFIEQFAPLWERFERWLDVAAGEKRKQSKQSKQSKADLAYGVDALDMPQVYRTVCQHLALARERNYSPLVIGRLSALTLRGHQALYGARGEITQRLANFIGGGFAQLVRRHWGWVLASTLLFFGPMLALIFALQKYPDFAYTVLGSEAIKDIEAMYHPSNHAPGRLRDADSDVTMFAYYIWNNVKVGFQTFGGGVLFGVGSAFFLLSNGMIIGTVAGHLHQVGYGATFWPFVAGHASLELTAIVLSGAGGLMLGAALIRPGQHTRRAALARAAQPAVRIAAGAAGMFMLAAIVEGFWSPHTMVPAPIKIWIGVALWVPLIAYFLFAGRRATE